MPTNEFDGLPVIDVDESEKINVAVSADDLQSGDPKDPDLSSFGRPMVVLNLPSPKILRQAKSKNRPRSFASCTEPRSATRCASFEAAKANNAARPYFGIAERSSRLVLTTAWT